MPALRRPYPRRPDHQVKSTPEVLFEGSQHVGRWGCSTMPLFWCTMTVYGGGVKCATEGARSLRCLLATSPDRADSGLTRAPDSWAPGRRLRSRRQHPNSVLTIVSMMKLLPLEPRHEKAVTTSVRRRPLLHFRRARTRRTRSSDGAGVRSADRKRPGL